MAFFVNKQGEIVEGEPITAERVETIRSFRNFLHSDLAVYVGDRPGRDFTTKVFEKFDIRLKPVEVAEPDSEELTDSEIAVLSEPLPPLSPSVPVPFVYPAPSNASEYAKTAAESVLPL